MKSYGSMGGQSLDTLGVDKLKQEEDDECPDDAITVGVFRFSQGGKKLDVDKLYTKCEAPDFMADK